MHGLHGWLTLGAFGALAVASADAAERTFVASTGNDANACTLAAPCRSFAAALVATTAGGELVVLDSAGYGTLDITKSVSIAAPPGVHAGITVPNGGRGIAIDAPGAKVVLRGLTISGTGGADGIVLHGAATLHVDRCTVTGMSNVGISITGPAEVFITDSATHQNASAGLTISGANATIARFRTDGSINGIVVSGNANVSIQSSTVSVNSTGVRIRQPLPPAATIRVAMSDLVVERNGGYGVLAESAQSGNVIDVAVSRSLVVGNGYGLYVHAMGGGAATIAATDNEVSLNTITGLVAGPYATLIASRNTVTRNLAGMSADFVGHLLTRGDNVVEKNGTDLNGTMTSIGGK